MQVFATHNLANMKKLLKCWIALTEKIKWLLRQFWVLQETATAKLSAQRGQLDKAASTLMSAADKADNNTLSPIFLMQAGEILVKQGKYDDAVDAYTKIKDKYFQSYQAMDIDKYIEQAKLMKK